MISTCILRRIGLLRRQRRLTVSALQSQLRPIRGHDANHRISVEGSRGTAAALVSNAAKGIMALRKGWRSNPLCQVSQDVSMPDAKKNDVGTEFPSNRVCVATTVFNADYPSIPGYEITGFLGRGGMATVYSARHIKLDRLVALKVLPAPVGGAERVRIEAQSVAMLASAHIVQIYDVGEHGGLCYLALEYVRGGSLDEAISKTPQAPEWSAQVVAMGCDGNPDCQDSGHKLRRMSSSQRGNQRLYDPPS